VKILFVHQSFPGQFKFLAPALVAQGHDVAAMTMQKIELKEWQGVQLIPYKAFRGTTPNVHPWVSDFESKTIRAEAAFRTALNKKEHGFYPDVIIAHPGWGESLFLKEVWPLAKLGIYCEFFYSSSGADVGFDPEFQQADPTNACRIKLKNLNNLLHFSLADAGISPTYWQANTFPKPFSDKISVVHDGIDTKVLIPNPDVSLSLRSAKGEYIFLTKSDEVITFVNRNLEPYRGFHIFMRCIPELLKYKPNVHVLIVGGDDVSYGARPVNGQKWKDIFIAEIRQQISDEALKQVHFLGNLPYENFISILQLSSVHVYLTYPFVLSWSLLEAMSVGCAIIASDTAPVHEVIKHRDNGLIVDFFDFKALALEVSHLLESLDERKRLGNNARTFAKNHYDLTSVCLPLQLKWVKNLADN
jgi:glycosyltransferase involved in cell wall biosynthesis